MARPSGAFDPSPNGSKVAVLAEPLKESLSVPEVATLGAPLSLSGGLPCHRDDRTGKRGGKPCIRGLRITVYDVLEYLASAMSEAETLADFPELTSDDIRACLAFAADR